jgi:hypothetical protein
MELIDSSRLVVSACSHAARSPARNGSWHRAGKIGLLLLLLALLAGCVPVPAPSASPLATGAGPTVAREAETAPAAASAPSPSSTPEDRWTSLLQLRPYPYTAPLPPSSSSRLDGTYVKVDLSQAEHVHCLRCPDYLPEAGLWKLNLDRGVFRIYYEVTGWRSLGSFTTAGDEMQVFNDPNCPDLTGAYHWRLADGKLIFSVIEDECSIQLRAANLTKQPWLSCRPPNREAMVTDHWAKPQGCD